jgi:DNA-binding Lrp family transcriptional regulator
MANRSLDTTDEQLLSLLQANARLPAAALARRLGLSRSAVQERLKRLERDGVILGYSVLLAKPARPSPFAAHVMVTLEPKLHDRAITALRGMPDVRACHTVSGEYDLVIEVTAPSAEALDDILTRIGKLPGIARTTSSIVLSTKFDRR